MAELSDLPPEIIQEIVEKLPRSSLSKLSRTCRSLWSIAVPILYYSIDFFFSGDLNGEVLVKLESLSIARPSVICYIRELRVLGSWFMIYDEIESDLGSSQTVSPATMMLSALLAHIVQNSKLQLFSWDLPLAATEVLLHVLTKLETLESFSIRLSADHTSSPYYFPLRHFRYFKHLRKLSMTAILDLENLEDIAEILSCRKLEHLQISSGSSQVSQKAMTIFNSIPANAPIALHSLDIRGFDITNLADIWERIEPAKLEQLTLKMPEEGTLESLDEINTFWRKTLELANRPESRLVSGLRTLYTDAVCPDLTKCIARFSEDTPLQRLFLMPCAVSLLDNEVVQNFLNKSLPKFGSQLRTLVLFSLNRNEQNVRVDGEQIVMIAQNCANLEELGLSVAESDLDKLVHSLSTFRKLRSLHIVQDTPLSFSISGSRVSQQATATIGREFAHRIASVVERYPELHLRYLKLDSSPVYEFVRLRTGGRALHRRRSGRQTAASSPRVTAESRQLSSVRVERRSTRLYDDVLDSDLFSRKMLDW